MKGLTFFLYAFIPGGLERSNGVIYLKLVEEFERSAVDTAWVVSLSSTARLLLGEYRIFFNLFILFFAIGVAKYLSSVLPPLKYIYFIAARGLCSSSKPDFQVRKAQYIWPNTNILLRQQSIFTFGLVPYCAKLSKYLTFKKNRYFLHRVLPHHNLPSFIFFSFIP